MNEKELRVQLIGEFRQLLDGLKGAGDAGEKEFARVDTALDEMANKSEHTGGMVGKLKEMFSEVGSVAIGVFTGGALLGGIQAITGSLEDLFAKGKAGVETVENMELAFRGAGLSGAKLEEQFDRTSKNASALSERFGVSSEKIKNVSSQAAFLGGALGKTNDDITTLAIGIEKITQRMGGAVIDSAAIIKTFSAGLGDPEAQANLGRLKKSFPELATALKGVTDPAEQLKVAMDTLGPKFDIMGEQTKNGAGAIDVFKNKVSTVIRTVGMGLFEAISVIAIPVLNVLVGVLGFVAKVFASVTHFISENAVIFGILASAIGIAVIATNAQAIATTIVTTVTSGWAAITGVMEGAQWLLNAALSANPIGIVIVAIGALVAGIVYAYNHSTAFRNILNSVWEAIKTGIEFFLKWLNPVGLMIQAWKFLYNNLGFVRDAVDAVVGAFKQAIEVVKDVGSFLGGLLGITNDETEATKKNTEAVKENAESEEDRAKKIKATQEAERAKNAEFRAGSDEDKKTAEDYRDRFLRNQRDLERGFQIINGQKVYMTDTDKKLFASTNEELKKQGIILAENVKLFNKQDEAATKAFHLSEDAAGTQKTALDLLKQRIQLQEKKEKLDQQTIDEAVANIEKEKTIVAGWKKNRIDGEEEINKAIEELRKKRAEILKKAIVTEGSELEQGIATLREKETEKLTDINTALKEHLIDETEAAKRRTDLHTNTENLIIKNTKEYGKKKLKEAFDTLKAEEDVTSNELRKHAQIYAVGKFETEEFIIKESARRQLELVNASLLTDKEKLEERNKIYEQKNASLLKIETDRIAKEKELSLLKIESSDGSELNKKLDSMQVSFDAEQNLLRKNYEAKVISKEEYEITLLAMSRRYATEREKVVRDEVQKENLLWKASTDVISKLVDQLTAGIQNTLNKLFKWESAESKKTDEKVIAEKKQKSLNEIASIDDAVKKGQISYEEGLAKRKKAEDDANAASEQQAQQHASFMKTITKGLTDSLIGLASQAAKAFIQSEIAKLIAGQATATGGLIASIMTSLPFPANVLAIGGGIAAIAALFGGLLGNANEAQGKTVAAAEGGIFDKPVFSRALNGGRNTFAEKETEIALPLSKAPDLIAKTLRTKEFESALFGGIFRNNNSFGASYMHAHSGSTLPPVAPSLQVTSAVRSNEGQQEVFDKIHAVMDKIATDGIPIDFTLKGEDLFGATRAYDHRITRRVYTENQ